MWYVKKAASKVMKASQSILKQQTEAQKLIKDIISNKHDVMPTKKMATLAAQSFETQKFQQVIQFMIQKLNDIKIEKKSLKKRLNLLVLVVYLIKYGVSGFIDQFRLNIDSFTKYSQLSMNELVQQKQNWAKIVAQIQNRAKYIKTLLSDKAVLARQKEVGRLIRQKMMLQGGDYSMQNLSSKGTQQQQKVESFLEHYVWRYTSKLDKKLDQITDSLIAKIDNYLDGQIPESFDIDQQQLQSNKTAIKYQLQIKSQISIKKENEFITERMPNNLLIKNTNLLELQIQSKKEKKQQNLIEFGEKQSLPFDKAQNQNHLLPNSQSIKS